MKFNIAKKVVFLMFLSLVSLQANDMLSLKLQNQITNNFIDNLEKRFDKYNKKVEKERQNYLDNLAFSNLYNSNLSSVYFVKFEKKLVRNEK